MESFEIEFEGDSEGYVTYECPFCDEQFKLVASEIQDEYVKLEELFCPYCGLVDSLDKFYSKEVVEYIQSFAAEWMMKAIHKNSGLIRGSKNIKVDFKKVTYTPIGQPIEIDSVEEVFVCKMCEKNEKVLCNIGFSKIFCAYCGGDL